MLLTQARPAMINHHTSSMLLVGLFPMDYEPYFYLHPASSRETIAKLDLLVSEKDRVNTYKC